MAKRSKKKKKKQVITYWTEGRCRKEAKKYKYLSDFYRYSESAYRTALRRGWFDQYTWLERKTRKYWTEESVMEEGRKYVTRREFRENCESGWRYAYDHKILDKMDWLIDMTYEMRKFEGRIHKKIFNLLITVGVTATREWLFLESGMADKYTEDERKLLSRYSRIVNERWAMWKKYKWYLYDDMKFSERDEDDLDESLHIKP